MLRTLTPEETARRELGPPKILDNTMRVGYHQCQRKFYWTWVRGVDYLVRPSYFAWGSAWHEIKGHWHRLPGAQAEPYSPEWKEAALEALTIGLDYWDNSGATDIRLDNRDNLTRLWKAYVLTYPSEPWSLVKGGAELGWLWPLPLSGGRASSYFLGGSMDGYIDYPGFGTMPLEEKTTGIWLSDFWLMQWRFSSQVTGYFWYIMQLVGECAGVLLHMTTKQLVKGTGKTPQFAIQIESRTEDALREFEQDWRRDIENIEKSWDRWHFPKTTDTINCTGGIGKAACPYKGLCLSGLPPALLDPMSFPNLTYRREKWEPWKRSTAESRRGISKSLPFSLQIRKKRKGISKELLNKIERRK